MIKHRLTELSILVSLIAAIIVVMPAISSSKRTREIKLLQSQFQLVDFDRTTSESIEEFSFVQNEWECKFDEVSGASLEFGVQVNGETKARASYSIWLTDQDKYIVECGCVADGDFLQFEQFLINPVDRTRFNRLLFLHSDDGRKCLVAPTMQNETRESCERRVNQATRLYDLVLTHRK